MEIEMFEEIFPEVAKEEMGIIDIKKMKSMALKMENT